MELFLSIAYVALFVFLIGKMKFFNVNQISKSNLKAGYLVKVLAGVSVGLIYTYYYTDRQTADTFKFFDDSKILFDSIYNSPFDFIRMLTGIGAGATELQPYYDKMTNWYDTFSPYNDNRTMIRLNALLRFFSLGHYYVHVVFVCFLSLTGIVAIVKVFAREFPEKVLEIFLVFLLLPSVLFWGSGLLKDSLVFFALGMVMYFFDRYLYESSNRNIHLFLTFVSLFLLMISKFHVFVLLIPLIVAWWVAVRYKLKPFLSFFASSFIFLGILILLSYLNPAMNLAAILAQKQAAFFNLADETAAGSAI
ncbi:MAG TPA: hypothetical protein PKD91_15615 [Bacteroidia bacterium]|nr:hypothetical protein [Bacteroidia bacterium]